MTLKRKLLSITIISLMLLTLFVVIAPMPAAAASSQNIQGIPLYRCWNGHVHWYTTNAAERDSWIAGGWTDEGTEGYLSPVPLPNTIPLYRCMRSGDLFLTTDAGERDGAVANLGFVYQGIVGYVVPGDDPNHGELNLYRWYHPQTPGEKASWFDKLVGAGDGFAVTDAHHFYQTTIAQIPGYSYEGVACRVWSSPQVMQEIRVTAPNGGESFKNGEVKRISWTSVIDGGNIHLYYATDGGAANTWTMIKENLPNELANNRYFDWTVPNVSSSKMVVKANWVYKDPAEGAEGYAYDTSDSNFTITSTAPSWLVPGLLNSRFSLVTIYPLAPSNLVVSANAQKTLSLYWKDNAVNESGFKVERKTEGGTYAQIAQVGANASTYIDASVKAGTKYYYRVKATGSTGDSAYSNEAAGAILNLVPIPGLDLRLPGLGTGTGTGTGTSGQISMEFIVGEDAYKINGINTPMDVAPLVMDGRTMLPIRYVTTPLGAGLEWVAAESKVVIKQGNNTIELWIGKNTARINGNFVLIDSQNPSVMPLIIEGRTMMPLRFTAENLGCTLGWDAASQKITIKSGK